MSAPRLDMGMPPPPVGMPQTSVDFDIVEFVNDLPPEVPLSIRRKLWGYNNRLMGLTFMNDREADAQIHRVYVMAMDVKRSIPARKIDDNLCTELENFIEFCKLKIYQAKLRPRGMMNERIATGMQVTESVISGGEKKQQRKTLLPWGPI